MSKAAKKLYRRQLSPQFAEASGKKQKTVVASLLSATGYVRNQILMPASKDLSTIAIERKDTEGQRDADAKTFSIKTDKECEAEMTRMLTKMFPKALLISEEEYGARSPESKRQVLEEALSTDRMVILTDPLDATRDFRNGGDGYAVMVAVVNKGEITAAVAHRCTDGADLKGFGHTLTFEANDNVRRDGRLLTPLSSRTFPSDPFKLRGYACIEFAGPVRAPGSTLPDLTGKFDSTSDLFTASKVYNDLITGQQHFMLIPPPADIFDYTIGIAIVNAAGGTAKFLDGTPATFAEIVRRQDCTDAKSLHNTLVFAVAENVFETVQKTVYAAAELTPPAKKARPANPAL